MPPAVSEPQDTSPDKTKWFSHDFFEFFAKFSRFSPVFRSFWTCSDLCRRVWMPSDAFGCIRMRPDAFGCVWTLSEIFDFFRKISSKTKFFAISARFRRSWRQTDLKISFCVEFGSRYTYPEVCATQDHEKMKFDSIKFDFNRFCFLEYLAG